VRGGKRGLAKSFTLRYARDGRERWMGLGSAYTVSLKAARDKALEARRLLDQGIDPLQQKRDQRAAQRAAAPSRDTTFAAIADRFIARYEGAWRNATHRQQWRSSIVRFCNPVIGDTPVADVDGDAVQRVLEPLWRTLPVVAQRLRGRIEQILDHAHALGLRSSENPAAWRRVKNLLPKIRRAKVHHAAIPYREAPALMGELNTVEGNAARALQFTLLTAVRTGEAIGAKWDEIDLVGKTWIVPSHRTKSGRSFHVPLSAPALRILEALPREDGNPHVFIGLRRASITRSAMLNVLQRLRPGLTVHGLRSTFADWATEQTSFSYEVREGALAHHVGSSVERAYRRGDLLDQRRQLAAAWGAFLTVEATDKVVPLRREGGER
jgi:integrase